jgi:hypothetical protein
MSHPAPAQPARTTLDLFAVADLSDGAKALLAGAKTSPPQRAFVDALVEREMFPDAVRFIAHALPRREAVWWAWVCARKAAGAAPPPAIKAALDATEQWIMQPTDETRRQAMHFAEIAEFGTPAGAAGLSAFLSGGGLGPPEAPPVAPGEFMTAKAVSGSVTLAAVVDAPEHATEKFKEYIRLGLEVAERTKLWAA